MYTNTSISDNLLAVYMAKLYWRVKKNGKWTWVPATYHDHGKNYQLVINYQEENK